MLATIVKNRIKEFTLSLIIIVPHPTIMDSHCLRPQNMVPGVSPIYKYPKMWYQKCSLFRIPNHGPRSEHYLGPKNMVPGVSLFIIQKCGTRSVLYLGFQNMVPEVCTI